MAERKRFLGIDEERWKEMRPLVLATIVPVVAAIAVFVVASSDHPAKKDVSQEPSLALYEACLQDNGLDPVGGFATQFDAQVAAQQGLKQCGKDLPRGALDGSGDRNSLQARYRECLKNMGANRGSSFGRFRFGPSSRTRSAMSICRSLLDPRDGDGQQPTPTTTTTPADNPAAPVA